MGFFLDIINEHLIFWMEIWKNHKMSTEKNKTPLRLYNETDYEKVTSFVTFEILASFE